MSDTASTIRCTELRPFEALVWAAWNWLATEAASAAFPSADFAIWVIARAVSSIVGTPAERDSKDDFDRMFAFADDEEISATASATRFAESCTPWITCRIRMVKLS